MKRFPPTYLPGLLIALLLGLACQPGARSEAPPESVAGSATSASPEASIRRLTRELVSSPDNYALYEQRSRLYYEQGRLDSAIQDIDRAIELFRNGPELHYLRGFYAFSAGDTSKALAEFEAAIGLGSDNPESYYQKAQIHFLRQEEALARQGFQQAAAMDSLEPTYVFAQGLLEERHREYQAAERTYQQALALDSSFAKAWIQLYDLNQELGRPQRAQTYLEGLLQQDPGHPAAQFRQGKQHLDRALKLTGQDQLPAFQQALNEAVAAFTIAVNRSPHYVQALYHRGYCYFLGDQYELALRDFEAVLVQVPTHEPSLFMMGSLHEFFQDRTTALTYYKRLLAVNPQHPEAQQAVRELGQQP